MNWEGKPHLKKLYLEVVTSKMLELSGPGVGAVANGIANGNLQKAARFAREYLTKAIAAIKDHPENKYGQDDDAIAKFILEEAAKKKATRAGAGKGGGR